MTERKRRTKSSPQVTQTVVTVGRTISLAPFESLKIEISETYDNPEQDPVDRDRLATRLSKRMFEIEVLERKRYARLVKK